MRSILQYFDRISDIIEYSEAELAEIEFEQIDSISGMIDGVLYFHDHSRLEFTEIVTIQKSYAHNRLYRYQYIQAEEAIFRYDNAPHHPDLVNFPHHKHIGRKKVSSTEPTLAQVLDEISKWIKDSAFPLKKARKQPRTGK
ncbi:MAG: DUF6516 family protein [Acidobacteriota bacterium]